MSAEGGDILSMLPRRLHLQIICKSGASIERILASWGTLPLIVRFKGGPKSKSVPKNIAIALRYPDRVRENRPRPDEHNSWGRLSTRY
jgi:hypothetical protein